MILVIQAALQSLTDLNSEHEKQGRLLYETCKGELFPPAMAWRLRYWRDH